MRNTSILVFGLAILLGLLTVFLARGYINEQRARPVEQLQVDTVQDMGTLVVAEVPLNFGDEITVESLIEVPWPLDVELRPENSFSKISDVIGSERRVAIRSIGEREPIVQNKISGFGYRATLSQVVDPSMRAVAIRVNDVAGVGGFVLPGDRVDVIFTNRDRQNESRSESRVIIRDTRVLAIDQTADESTAGAIVSKAATLEVDLEQAQKLALAAKIGDLDLVLRPMTAEAKVLDDDAKTIKLVNLVNDNGADAEAIPASRPRTRRVNRMPAPSKEALATMAVTRGVRTSETEIPKAGDTKEGLAGAAIATSATDIMMGSPNP